MIYTWQLYKDESSMGRTFIDEDIGQNMFLLCFVKDQSSACFKVAPKKDVFVEQMDCQ